MRYIDLRTQEEIMNAEPTYNRFQIVAGSITAAAAVGVFAYTIVSLISALV